MTRSILTSSVSPETPLLLNTTHLKYICTKKCTLLLWFHECILSSFIILITKLTDYYNTVICEFLKSGSDKTRLVKMSHWVLGTFNEHFFKSLFEDQTIYQENNTISYIKPGPTVTHKNTHCSIDLEAGPG